MPRPIIGITTDYNDRLTQYAAPYGYATSVERAGGLPFFLAYRTDPSLIPEIVDQLDGLLLCGGADLDPAGYGEQPHPMRQGIDPFRETFERALLAEVEKRRMPTLGICLGSQLMNVHRGGSLIQFIPDEPMPGGSDRPIEHRMLDDWSRRHEAKLVPGTPVADRLGHLDIIVNTSHKQAVRTLGRGLRIIANAPDGIIEGIDDPTYPLFLGIQWHPERMSEEKDHLELFKMLIEKSREAK